MPARKREIKTERKKERERKSERRDSGVFFFSHDRETSSLGGIRIVFV